MTSFNPDLFSITQKESSRPNSSKNSKQHYQDNANYLQTCSFTLSSKESLHEPNAKKSRKKIKKPDKFQTYQAEKIFRTPRRTSADSSHLKDISYRYQYQRKLGKGTYGHVMLAVDTATEKLIAVKTIKKSKLNSLADRNRVQREIDIGQVLSHSNIIQIEDVIHLNKRIYITLEYAAHGELYDLLIKNGALPEQTSKDVFSQICKAVQYCHEKAIVHRDLKLENILVTQIDPFYTVKLADFGLANKFKHLKDPEKEENRDHLLTTFCGSLLYASPEVVQGRPYYGPKVDSWAMGVILYALIYGAMPFEHTVQPVLLKQIVAADFYRHKNRLRGEDVIEKLLTIDPAERLAVSKIVEEPWLRQSYEIIEICSTTSESSEKRRPSLVSTNGSINSTDSGVKHSSNEKYLQSNDNLVLSPNNPFRNSFEQKEKRKKEKRKSKKYFSSEEFQKTPGFVESPDIKDESFNSESSKSVESYPDAFTRLDELTEMMSSLNRDVDSFLNRAYKLHQTIDAVVQ